MHCQYSPYIVILSNNILNVWETVVIPSLCKKKTAFPKKNPSYATEIIHSAIHKNQRVSYVFK